MDNEGIPAALANVGIIRAGMNFRCIRYFDPSNWGGKPKVDPTGSSANDVLSCCRIR